MTILGIDEVGRGPWAGPLVIGAVILPDEKPAWVADLTDSKKLTAKKREALNEIISKEAVATGLGWVSSQELDKIGLSAALKLAARRAVEEVRAKHPSFQEIIIDGTINFLTDTSLGPYVTTLKKADFLIKEVSAASIIAKVARDHYMYDLAKKYPEYGFETHVGYGTAAHRAALATYGPCPEHRKSFRPVLEMTRAKTSFLQHGEPSLVKASDSPIFYNTSCVVKNNTREYYPRCEKGALAFANGRSAETVVADYLTSAGHTIVARNHKTKFYEIDIISAKDDKIYFTEVKYRKSEFRGTALDQITPQKLRQMRFAAESFLKFKPQFKNYNPILAAASVAGDNFKLQDWFEIN